MRSPAEIAFRLKQELANLYFWKFPPALTIQPGIPRLPDPSRTIATLQSTPFAAEIVRLADEICRHRFPIFDEVLETGEEIRWRRDYAHGIETGLSYFRRIPYLDFQRAGDHKYIWELNRHQHLVVLAQAFRFTGNSSYLREAESQVTNWLAGNPFLQGINWTSALEVAFRAISWIWLDHLAGEQLAPAFRRALAEGLYRHGYFLEHNLSVYFSPNTHLLGEAVALDALGRLYPEFPRSARWRARGAEVIEQQMRAQVRADGAHFEQSSYYHVYALDFFLWHALLAEPTPEFQNKLFRMAEYLDALLGTAGSIPLIGDDDGGRLFHPYGNRPAFGRASLATCGVYFRKPEWVGSADDLAEQAAWWIGASAFECAPAWRTATASRLFPESGTAIMAAGDIQIVIKAGGFGPASGGHSHSDALSFVCRRGSRDILCDAGTFTYLADPAWRDRFRGSAAHSTILIDQLDQARPAGPFRWEGRPDVRILEWTTSADEDRLVAECRFATFLHRRRFVFRKPALLFVVDEIEGPPGDHLIEQFWHAGSPEDFAGLISSHPHETVESWRSQCFGSRYSAAARRVINRGPLPIRLAAALSFDALPEALLFDSRALQIRFRGSPSVTLKC